MERTDVQMLLAMVQGAYPNFNPPSKTATINAWTIALEDIDKDLVAMAFKTYMRTNASGFAPTPGQLIAITHDITAPQELTEMEAWAVTCKAISNSSYNYMEEYAKLPPLVQKTVGLPSQLHEWAIDENINMQVVASNFMRSYSVICEREKELSKMSPDVLKLIRDIANGSYKAELELKRSQMINATLGEEKALI